VPLYCDEPHPRPVVLGALPQVRSQAINQSLVEFMQLLSMLRAASVSALWSPGLLVALGAVAPFTPATTSSWISPDCMWPASWAASRPESTYFLRIGTALLTPAAYVALIAGMWVLAVLGRAAAARAAPAWHDHKPHLLLGLLTAVSYCYTSFANAVLSIFSCRTLDPGTGGADGSAAVPGEVQAAVGSYWNGDLNVQCWTGAHLTFVLAVGLPGLFIIIAYPALIAIVLVTLKRRGRPFYGSRFWALYGFMYQDFRPRIYFFRAVTELRKLAFVAAIVGLGSQSTAAQLLGAWGVSLAMLLSHLGLSPMHHRAVSRLQTASLGAIAAAVLLQLLIAFQPPGSSGSLFCQGLLVFMTLCVVVRLLVALLGYYYAKFGGLVAGLFSKVGAVAGSLRPKLGGGKAGGDGDGKGGKQEEVVS
jgi:hypothetical protein